MAKNRNGNRNGGGIPKNVTLFAEATFKKHKKEYGDYYDSKKALRKDYYDYLSELLPDVIPWLLRNSHKPDERIQVVKNQCYTKFAGEKGPEFTAHLTKIVEKFGRDEIPNIIYLPIILSEIISEIIRYNTEKQETGEALIESPDDLYTLSTAILKKKLKKAKKKGLPDNLAFDLFSIMPDKDAAKFSVHFRIKSVFDIMYHYAADEVFPVSLIIELLFNEADYQYVIGYALQERKDKYRSFNEKQKKLFNDITTWVFDELENMNTSEIRKIIGHYINIRKRDAAAGKDSIRRYYISSLPEKDYPKIMKVVEGFMNASEDNKKYL